MARLGLDAFIFHPRASANAGTTDPMQLAEIDAGSQSRAFLHDAPTSPSQAHPQSTSDGYDWLVHHDSTALMHAHIADLHANAVFIH